MFETEEIFVPKEIAALVQDRLDQNSGKVFDEIWTWLIENTGHCDVDVTCVFRTATPEGHRFSDGEYQDFIGKRYYLPIEGSEDYLGCEYIITEV